MLLPTMAGTLKTMNLIVSFKSSYLRKLDVLFSRLEEISISLNHSLLQFLNPCRDAKQNDFSNFME